MSGEDHVNRYSGSEVGHNEYWPCSYLQIYNNTGLWLWISQDNPSFGLTRAVNYLIYVWAEVFLISRHLNLVTVAPRLLLLEVMVTRRSCSKPEQELLEKSISFNGQMGHQESVLLVMQSSPNMEERCIAVAVSLRIRGDGPMKWTTVSRITLFK